jgi:hypothetical protein
MSRILLPAMLASALLTSPAVAQGQGQGQGPGPGAATGTCTGTGVGTGTCTPVLVPATADEAKWLTFMREEERLAQDVYQFLGEKWKLKIFQNIALSESKHTAAVGTMLTRYGLPDPSLGLPAGTYADQGLNELYAQLIAKGSLSIKDALEVGLTIETKDIADLETALKVAEKFDIKRVYTNLMDASFNHQEAFETCLEIFG